MTADDEQTTEFLIQHHSLEDVLSFALARDEVRRIPAPVAERPDAELVELPEPLEPEPLRPTMPAAGVDL